QEGTYGPGRAAVLDISGRSRYFTYLPGSPGNRIRPAPLNQAAHAGAQLGNGSRRPPNLPPNRLTQRPAVPNALATEIAILVGVQTPDTTDRDPQEGLDELALLADTAGATV